MHPSAPASAGIGARSKQPLGERPIANAGDCLKEARLRLVSTRGADTSLSVGRRGAGLRRTVRKTNEIWSYSQLINRGADTRRALMWSRRASAMSCSVLLRGGQSTLPTHDILQPSKCARIRAYPVGAPYCSVTLRPSARSVRATDRLGAKLLPHYAL